MKLPIAVCPRCKTENDAATCIGDDTARPKPGDVWICFRCGLIAIFGDDMLPRSARRDELPAIVESGALRIAAECLRASNP